MPVSQRQEAENEEQEDAADVRVATDGRRGALTVALLAEPHAVAELRRTVGRHLTYWGLGECSDTAQLCVSELVTNVIDHVGAGAPITLRVVPAVDGPRIELTDPDPRALPTLLTATDDQESGRGLALLDAFTTRWGVIQHSNSKTTWCQLHSLRAERSADRSPYADDHG